jgi:hypothetical protein
MKHLFAAAAALALFAAPALACDECNKKDVTAQADKKEGCHCKSTGADGKCKCGDKCTCDHCKPKGAEKKDDAKKT